MQLKGQAKPGWIAAWVANNSGYLALAVVAAAFVLRFSYASSCYLNPDEAYHFDFARTNSWSAAYQASRQIAHPPLFILVLHGVLMLGRTELMLRLTSLLSGTFALVFTFAWLRHSLGAIPALAGLVFMALSPAAISASTEVRQYGLLLLFVCGSLYAAERVLTERSIMWAVIEGLMLMGALLSQYSSTIVIASLAIYLLVSLKTHAMPRSVFFASGAFYLALAVLLIALYVSNIRGVIPFGPGHSMDYLRHYYYTPTTETLPGFVRRTLLGTFTYVTGDRWLAVLLMCTFLAGIVALLARRTKAAPGMAVLLISPFVVGFAGALLQIFPFAGSRHQAYLLPFLAAGIAAVCSAMRDWGSAPLWLLAGVTILPLTVRAAPDNDPRAFSMTDMRAAIDSLHRTVPPGAALFVDRETREELRYYLARDEPPAGPSQGNSERLGGYRIIVPAGNPWAFQPDEVVGEVNESAQTLHLSTGEPLWIISTAWLEPSLTSRIPNHQGLDSSEFGRISLIRAFPWNNLPVQIHWSDARQTIDGFGAATASVNPELSPGLMDFFFTGKGIHLRFIRVQLWPNVAECEGNLAPGECVAATDATISKFDLANAQAAVARGAFVWGTEWSPPAAMKTKGGSFRGGTGNFAKLADIQTSFVTLLKRYGIPLYALSPQNEPDKITTYPSCIWTAEQFRDYIPYLANALRSSGSGSVRIMVSEQSYWGDNYILPAMSDSRVASKIGIAAAHGYGLCCSTRLLKDSPRNPHVWETEISDFRAYDGSIVSGLEYATALHLALTEANVNAWNYWSLSGILFKDNQGLTDSMGNLAKRAYTLGNFSKFILPEWTRVDVANSTRLLVSAYADPHGNGAAVVVVNKGPEASDQAFSVGSVMGNRVVPWVTSNTINLEAQAAVGVSSGMFKYTVPANSVVTFVPGGELARP